MNCFVSLKNFFSDIFSIFNLMLQDDSTYEVIAWGAAVAIVSAFIIQTIRILISKSVSGISSYMYIMYSLAFACWFTYGVHIESMALVVSNLIIFLFTFLILLLILYYDEEDKIDRKYRDPLTRVFNKRYFEEKIPLMSADFLVNGKQFVVVALKINNLEKINKNFGSKYVNRAQRAVARSLDKSLRETDIIARVDNNLFMIFLCGVDKEISKSVLNRLMESFENISIKKGKEAMGVDILMGVCPWEENDNLVEYGIKAQAALEKASMKKNNRIKYYENQVAKTKGKKNKVSKIAQEVKEIVANKADVENTDLIADKEKKTPEKENITEKKEVKSSKKVATKDKEKKSVAKKKSATKSKK